MRIWVDADACPRDIRELLFRAAVRRKVQITLVANQPVRVPKSEFIDTVQVGAGANVADQRIVELMAPEDLVVTADIPLAAGVVKQGGQALDPRGQMFSEANIGERLAMRDLLDGLRGSGEIMGGPATFSDKDRQTFANQLDRWLTSRQK
ncbi:YaiI/YqxD family protein [Rubinisphaera margarita]|uniref:YaiI/YqxD family protein n=1 Tax=Rubinisphaera margarita TaxID=2909586 RepID=UPI001EE7D549|nr:YaiI/YqxD family protein [Rubinisphaera margarita]MCG6156485.1 YaiI/YqxD family protein [Rubinisphaera margarita]